MSDTITAEWEVDDGYMGGRRPHTTKIDVEAFEGLTRAEAEQELHAQVKEDYDQNIGYDIGNFDEILEQLCPEEPESAKKG